MKLCSITPRAGGFELRVYEVGHAAASRACRRSSVSAVTPSSPISCAAAITRGQCSTAIDRLRFISEAVEARLSPITLAKAVGPPNASIRSGTDCMSTVLQNFCSSCQQDFCFECRHNFWMEQTPGQRLVQARLRAGYKTAQAAVDRFNWTYTTYKSHENGQTPVPSEDAKEYARAYGVTPQWIVFNTGSIDDPGLDNLLEGKSPELKQHAINSIRGLIGLPPIEPLAPATSRRGRRA